MPRYSHKLKLSINSNLTDKEQPSHKDHYAKGFDAVEGTINELADTIIEEGWAFSYQFENGVRKKENFIATDILPIDIDGGMKLPDMMEDPIVKKYCSLIYTTPSHTPDHHRYRLVFILPDTVTDPSKISAAARSLTRRLGGDSSATDPARIFFGSKGGTKWIYDNYMSKDFFDELVDDGKVQPNNDSKLNKNKTTNRSALLVKDTKSVKISDGTYIDLKDLNTSTSIFCPFHNDHSPSAFVAIANSGGKFIHCSSCQLTWWVEGSNIDLYDFNAFDNAIKKVSKLSQTLNSKQSPLSILADSISTPTNIFYTNKQFLNIAKVEEGITFIKSPKGTGKTSFLSESIRKVIEPNAHLSLVDIELETDHEEEEPKYSDERVLLIGHRQALIGDLCNKLHLNCYLDDTEFKATEIKERQKRYGICLDSIKKIALQKYDIIVIDEVEQVLSHFMSETIGEKRKDLFVIFSQLISNTKKVIALDSDIGWVSFTTITKLANDYSNSKKDTYIHINEYKQPARSLNLYQYQSQLVADMLDKVSQNKRIFVTSNSKEKIKTLEKTIQKFVKGNNLSCNILTITSENSRTLEIQDFIKNIATKILDYDVVLSSPSLGTGIDITFENQRQKIDSVFGFFENLINSHFEVDQQISRVRQPKNVNIWINPATYNFETDFKVVTKDYLEDNLFDQMSLQIDVDKDNIPTFYRMAGLILSEQRASKNNLKNNFVNYKKHQGWTISVIDKDEGAIEFGKEIFKEGKRLKEIENHTNILKAKPLDQYQYNKFKQALERNDGSYNFSSSNWYSFYRTKYELLYREKVSEELLASDTNGKLAKSVLIFENLISTPNFLKNNSSATLNQNHKSSIASRLFKNKTEGILLMYGLLSSTSIFKDGKFLPDVIFTKHDLVKFALAVKKFKRQSELHLDINVRADILTNPVQHLTKLLKTIGLKLKKPKSPTTHNGEKTYYYSLDKERLDFILGIVKRRQNQLPAWDFVNKLHGFKYTALEQSWLDDYEAGLNPI